MKRGRFIKYDKQKVLQLIVDGKLSAQEIADSYGITRNMVYTLKYTAKKKNIIRDPVSMLDDLDPVEPRAVKRVATVNVIYNLAQEYKEGMISPATFYKEVKRTLEA